MNKLIFILLLVACFHACLKPKPKPHKSYVIRIYEGCFTDETKVFGWEDDPVDYTGAYHVEHRGDTAIISYPNF